MYNENYKHFYDFLYVEDQVILLELNYRFDINLNLTDVSVIKNYLFDENYREQKKCRINMNNIFDENNQITIFENCCCKRDTQCQNCISGVTNYERFFSLLLGNFKNDGRLNEKEIYTHSDKKFKRKCYKYSEEHDTGHDNTLNILEQNIYGANKNLGNHYADWDVKLLCDIENKKITNAVFKPQIGDAESGLIIITDKTDYKEIYDSLLGNNHSAKTLLIYIKKGTSYEVYEEPKSNQYLFPDYANTSNRNTKPYYNQFEDIPK